MSMRQPNSSGCGGVGGGIGGGISGAGSLSKKSSATINSQYMRNMDAIVMERNNAEDAIFLSDSSTLHDSDDGGSGAGAGGVAGQRVAIEQRRRCYMQRSQQRKKYVEPQVMWSRNNIAATMERFEPTPTTPPQLEYGFAAGVVLPPTTAALQASTSTSAAAAAAAASGRHMHAATVHSTPGSPCMDMGLGEEMASTTSTPLNHVYSYAYYEPGMAKCHTNVPFEDDVIMPTTPMPTPTPPLPPPPHAHAPAHTPTIGAYPGTGSRVPSRHSIRTLLSKTLRARSQGGQSSAMAGANGRTSEDRHTYTTRYGTTENLYEEVSEQQMRKVLSDNRIASGAGGGNGGGGHNIKEELRRVQCNHFRVLDQLNLSLEALIMPPTNVGESYSGGGGSGGGGSSALVDDATEHTTSTASTSASSSTAFQRRGRGGLLGGSLSSFSAASTASSIASSAQPQQQQQQLQQRDLSHMSSLDILSNTLHAIELKDPAKAGACHNGGEFDEGDLDSGFSGSSSSGASCNESLRYFKTASGTSTSKSSMTSADDTTQCIGVVTGNRQRR